MEDQFAWKERGSELGWHVSTIYTAPGGLSNMPGTERRTGAGDRHQPDRQEIANCQVLTEEKKARGRAHCRLQAHQDAEWLAREAAQGANLPEEGNGR